MQNILIETLPGRIAYQDLKNASVEDFTYEFVGGVGVIHVSRQFIKYDDIFWGETEENPARAKGSSKNNIKGLADSRRKGIDPKVILPAVQETVITDIEGNTYRYKAENGITRKKADFYNGYKEGAWFDIVRYVETKGRSAEYNRRVWLHIENDPLPSEGNSIDDLVQSCSEMICSGDLPKEESSIRDFVYESAPNMPTQDKNEVVRIVLKEEGVFWTKFGLQFRPKIERIVFIPRVASFHFRELLRRPHFVKICGVGMFAIYRSIENLASMTIGIEML